MREIEITDDNQDQELPKLVGTKILSIKRERSSGESFEMGANHITVTLDNGVVLQIGSHGYDACGTTLDMEAPDAGIE